MSQFWVVGGEYTSTDFKEISVGKSIMKEGPFDTYEEAQKVWQKHAWNTVDNALAHFHIEEIALTLPTPSDVTETQFWVIGGHFNDINFDSWSDATESYGPYLTYAEAEKKWQQLAWATVDDANARYRIETLQPDSKKPKQRLAYRCLTGSDDSAFCEKVSKALAEGYALYGSPSISTSPDGSIVCAQAVILPAKKQK